MQEVPAPWACGLDAIRSLDGYVADHWSFRTSMCVSNRLVLALAIPCMALSLTIAVAMVCLLARDYKLTGKAMNMSKMFYTSSAFTSFGLMLGAMSFLVSGPWMLVLNSCTYMIGSQALIGAAYSTLFQWITVTSKMLQISDEEWLILRVQALRKTLLFPTYLVFAFCMPVCIIRAASSDNIVLYNVTNTLYLGGMLPWFCMWCTCASQFSVHFARLIEATVDGTKDFTFTIKKSAAGPRATISQIPHELAPTLRSAVMSSPLNPGSNDTANPAKERAIEMLAVAKRVRIVGMLIAADKIVFILIYVVLIIHGLLAWQRPASTSFPFGFYAIMLGGIPGANFLVLAMSYYHVSTGPSRATFSRSAGVTKEAL
ncbi:hypothetical protein HDU87_007705 [Geranomyces variabilis]|uniref:Uncharacterized protein n=1 Tax=Geranomyces variabilis TaxID=109894 RepID=A0AAD5TDU5_9FUNG|nr:hypothetical protein HDU87_007705 [Geranomyces variabilis]